MYFLKPKGYSDTAERVLVDFDGSASGITAKGPWTAFDTEKMNTVDLGFDLIKITTSTKVHKTRFTLEILNLSNQKNSL